MIFRDQVTFRKIQGRFEENHDRSNMDFVLFNVQRFLMFHCRRMCLFD